MIHGSILPRHNNESVTGKRPRFSSPDEWLSHYHDAVRNGFRPWPPATRPELLTADELGLFEVHPEWIPNRMALRLLGFPDCFGRTLEPFAERFKERFLSTLNADPLFATAVLNLLNREV